MRVPYNEIVFLRVNNFCRVFFNGQSKTSREIEVNAEKCWVNVPIRSVMELLPLFGFRSVSVWSLTFISVSV